MRQITIKLIATLLTLVFCIGFFTACKSNKDVKNANSTVNYYVDKDTGELISITEENTGDTVGNSKNETADSENKENGSSENKNTETTNNDVANNTSKTQGTNNNGCSHTSTTLKNKVSATCTKAGYTGDTYCTKCNKKISSGSQISATGHNTEIRNKKEATTTSQGYTGDKVCKTCGIVVESGQVIPKVENNNGKVEYILPDGSTIWLEPNADILGYFMAQKTKETNHFYLEVEKEILRLCNIERNNVGLKPLEWFEDAYYFTQIRAYESAERFSHTRPNGKSWSTVYSDNGVVLVGSSGENLFESEGISVDKLADLAVKSWMNSPGHKANILNGECNRIAIAIVSNGNKLTAVQNFFS